jgi:hypothetical protein
MATKTYKCTNYGDCDLALQKQVIEIEEGDDDICPGCSKKSLVPTDSKGQAAGSRGVPKVLILGVLLLVVIAAGWMLWPAAPNPDLANSMLSEFFPKLPK